MTLLPAHPSDRVATGVLLFSASLWGLSWMPLKGFIAQGLSGPLVALITYGSVGLLAVALLWRDRATWRAQWALVLALTFVGGWANTSFVNALMLGDVVRVMFLFYLSPVWSVLGGWLFLKERIPPTRWLAVVAAIVGLWMVLGGPGLGDSTALAFTWVDALSLSAGFAFAANNVIARAAHRVPLRTKTFCVFIGCGLLSALATGAGGQGLPTVGPLVWLALLAYGFGWMLLATVTWQYGVSHLESSRAGVILLAELVVSVGTAIAFGGESLTPLGWAGGALIATAAGVEALGGTPADTPATRTADTTA
ncbi:DMT family transporter [Hydrogenophaga sp. SL48]|uniref:DMT family transporter n=1 Tax=Hydrogenophaga sp. SL48 TaxID=2806347 RepID=UPI001F2F984B|nr:DMT family transporter [Hydrogenophaga sp. SL48]UJW80338.1 DMT family transporter [Hydrogenophaga sp. SL48]